jgi:hypothetical protein
MTPFTSQITIIASIAAIIIAGIITIMRTGQREKAYIRVRVKDR